MEAADYTASEPIAFSGGTLVLASPDSTLSPTYPSNNSAEKYDLLIHFHGSPQTVVRELRRSGLSVHVAIVNFSGLSSAYRVPFQDDPSLFEQLLQHVACRVGEARKGFAAVRERRIILSSFSAGYGAVREILKSSANFDRVSGYIAVDSIYASILKEEERGGDDLERRDVDPQQMKDFLRLAQAAKEQRKFFILTHSSQTTPYASTTETADYLIQQLGVARAEAKEAEHATVRVTRPADTVVEAGNFCVLGYRGTGTEDHLWHLREVGGFWSLARRLLEQQGLDSTDDDSGRSVPRELFDGASLNGWYTWLLPTKYEDPQDVFSVRDGQIRISGQRNGYLATESLFEDFQLTLEMRWGDRNYGKRVGKARDAGLFLGATGADGNSADGDGAFMAAVECQIMEGAVGDLLLIRGRDEGRRIPLSLSARIHEDLDADGWPFVIVGPGSAMRSKARTRVIKTWGRLNRREKRRDWQDMWQIADPSSREIKPGGWNRIQVRVVDGILVVALNGHVVNAASHVQPSAGKILLQSEGSEWFVRRVRLDPLR